MIHHIHSPRQLKWGRLGNVGVCFIWYSVLTRTAVACRLGVLWFLGCLGRVWIKPSRHHNPPRSPKSALIRHPSLSARCLWLNAAEKHREERRGGSKNQQFHTCSFRHHASKVFHILGQTQDTGHQKNDGLFIDLMLMLIS